MENILLVEESVDALYFTIQLHNPSDDYNTTEGLELQFKEEGIMYTYTFTNEDDLLKGVQIEPSHLVNYPANYFTDGIKDFTITLGTVDAVTSEGFAAVVAGKVMKEASTYRLDMEYPMKEMVWNKVILLGNLSMSATVGSVGNFMSNLKVLERVL